MKKSISTIIVAILLVLIVVSLSMSFLLWGHEINNIFKEAFEKKTKSVISESKAGLAIVKVYDNNITVKNKGEVVLNGSKFSVYLNGSLVDATPDKTSIGPGEILTLTLADPVGNSFVRVTGSYGTYDFVEIKPTTTSTTSTSSTSTSTTTTTTVPPNWFSGWNYRKNITINSSEVDGDLTNFPILVSTTDPELTKAQSDGDDILFTAGDGETQLDHEIEKFVGSTGELVAWVRIPSLSSSTDTNICIYYGNASASNQENVTGVWDSKYEGVWHLSETGTGTRYDSTSYGNDGTPNNYDGDEGTSGQIDGADNLDGTNDFIDMGNTACDVTDEITISLWFKTSGSAGSYAHMVWNEDGASPDHGYTFGFDGNSLKAYFVESNNRDWFITTNSFSDDKWYYAVTTYPADGSSRPKIYVNGTEQSGTLYGSPITSIGSTPSYPLHIGARVSDYFFDGIIDEVRISNTARSAGWLSTSYNTMNSPGTFLTFGSEES